MIGRLTLFTSESTLAKRWELDKEGKPFKTSAAQMTRGSYAVREFSTAAELAALLDGVTTRQAVSASLPLDGSASGTIVTQSALARSGGSK